MVCIEMRLFDRFRTQAGFVGFAFLASAMLELLARRENACHSAQCSRTHRCCKEKELNPGRKRWQQRKSQRDIIPRAVVSCSAAS